MRPGTFSPTDDAAFEARRTSANRLTKLSGVLLSPVAMVPFYLAAGSAGPAWAPLVLLVANITAIVMALRWMMRRWRLADEAKAAQAGQS